jgi:hypothetical protein
MCCFTERGTGRDQAQGRDGKRGNGKVSSSFFPFGRPREKLNPLPAK